MKQIWTAFMAIIMLTIVTAIIYPLCVTLVGKVFFPYQAGGSIITVNNQSLGSSLIGQQFTLDKYLWGRPSATGNYPYNALASSPSNFGALNPQLIDAVGQRVSVLNKSIGDHNMPIAVDLVTASGSGLDPDISPEAAYLQIARIAKARKLSRLAVLKIINLHTLPRTLGFLGEPRVNVLEVNLALDHRID
ncbi:MAG: potassium-transporting ATPase subunit KdpC [Bacteroidia bacterium]|nr:MAG: potassium-transporting ATPase subunit KdpC [Bacteroidia bacterium]